MARPRVMREEDLGRAEEAMDPGESLLPPGAARECWIVSDDTAQRLRELVRSSKIEQRFVGGLDRRRLAIFYLIEQKKLDDIFGGEP